MTTPNVSEATNQAIPPQEDPSGGSEGGCDHPGPVLVGLGASAGGLAALQKLFQRLPADTGAAFVVVVHLSPEHESHLHDVLQRHSKIPITQVTDTTAIEANHVYVIPPNANINTIDTHLRLSELEEARRERAPIDHFFRTLAKTHGHQAIGVVLTGTGSDGTLGLRRIKEAGGVTLVQDPEEAEHDGMPRSAIASGMVDRVLRLAEIAEEITHIASVRPRVPLSDDAEEIAAHEKRLLQKIFAQVRARTGHDFSHYKRSTIMRRIHRRMQLHHVRTLEDYLQVLRGDNDEPVALFNDLLITVTEFFRDERVFERLRTHIIPKLFDNKTADHDLRVWSVGCSTGEEAYSLAILLLEEAERRDLHPQIHVFASDLHEDALQRAREGIYPAEITADVSKERLARFFDKENGHYRIKREVRELVVFAPHNVLGDPPFSRLDLIVCRNLMIYLQRDVQEEVIGLFHYALNDDGMLLLGTSETIDGAALFACEDKDACLYRKRNVPTRDPGLPVFPLTHDRRRMPPEREPPPAREQPTHRSYGAIHERVVERYAPPSVLINQDHEVVHASTSVGRYLQVPGGEPSRNIFKLVREPLGIELRAALHAARDSERPSQSKATSLTIDKEKVRVVVRVHPAQDAELQGFFLVLFDETPEDPDAQPAVTDPDTAATVRELEAELEINRQRLQGVIEEYESSREEMQASNEELQSANEELRSTMEELETSKEELQSMNEELTTVNQENRLRVEELGQMTADLQNLLAATDIATLFLDRKLRIKRFTPKVADLFNIRHTDRGRPLADLTHHLLDADLEAEARRVLDRLVPVEQEVHTRGGQWFLSRVLPYRTGDDRIEGVVITLIDITSRKQAELQLRQSVEQFTALVEASAQMVWTTDGRGRVVDDSPTWRAFTGQSFQEWTGRGWLQAIHPDHRARAKEAWRQAVDAAQPLTNEWPVFHAPSGEYRWTSVRAVPLKDDDDDAVRGWVGMNSDITDQKRAEHALRDAKEYAEHIIESLPEPLLVLTPELIVKRANQAFYDHFKVDPDQTLGRKICELGNGQWDIPALRDLMENVLPDNKVFRGYEVEHQFPTLGRRIILINGRRLNHLQLILLGLHDITDRRQAETELRHSRDQLEHRVAERTAELELQTQRLRDLANELASAEQRERKRLAAVLHDELQQYLVALKMRLQVTRRQLTDTPQDQDLHEAVDLIDQSIACSRALTRQLTPPVLAEDGLAGALQWLAGEVKRLHGLTVHARTGGEAPPLDHSVEAMLFQCVRELLLNTVKHAGVDEAWLTLSRVDHTLSIRIEDRGAGCDPEAALRKNPDETAGGMGLASVAERMRALGGGMKIDAAPGSGTTVTLEVPVQAGPEDEDEPGPAPPELPSAEHAAGKRPCVLVVEDHAVVREGIATLLRDDGRIGVVCEAADGVEALEMVDRYRPHVVLMDVNLPKLDGIQATRQISERFTDVSVVGLSVRSEQGIRDAMLKAGAVSFLSKSDDFGHVIHQVLELVPDKQPSTD